MTTTPTEEKPRISRVALQPEHSELLQYLRDHRETGSAFLVSDLMAEALDQRFQTGIVHEHIYLKNDEVPQIQLFNILIEKFPFVKYGQMICNQAILQAMSGHEEVCLMDIGIGQGTQIAHVLQLASGSPTLKKVHIIGIEPFSDALRIAAERFNSMEAELSFEIEFTPVHDFAEKIDLTIFKEYKGVLIVNASLALHHIPTSTQRLELIRQLHDLNPAAFILTEPNVDHVEPDLKKRFINCYQHYYNLFCVIDRLDIDEKDKKSLKLFFGREIADVIGKDEMQRFEKHEPASVWIARLQECGFQLDMHALQSPVSFECGVAIGHHAEGYLGFTHDNETILALIYAK